MKISETNFTQLLNDLTNIGISLSAEKDHNRLLELILKKAQQVTNADGGTIYTCTEHDELQFEIMLNRSMKLHLGGTSKNKARFENLPLYDKEGNPNKKMLATWTAHSKKLINIKDAYKNTVFDLSGTKQFDKKMGYHSKVMLSVPMTNHLNEVIGVLQLINPLNMKTNVIGSFSKMDQHIVHSLASQAAITITNRQLIEDQKNLFDSLIQLIAQAIDEKSPYTGGHCRRVPVITRMIADATCKIDKGPLKDFSLSDDELYELEVAAWLHDCGKITTPEAIVDKSTKLEGIFDGIHLIDTRFEVVKRDAIIACLQDTINQLTGSSANLSENEALQEKILSLNQARELIRMCNIGGEYMSPTRITALTKVAELQWIAPSGEKEDLLSDKEVQMLGINRGTLSPAERSIINNHVTVSIKMLKSLPYPKSLKQVPLLAGSHHERIDGKGYPNGLTKDEMPLQARMIAIADIFEALTAGDRPYKKSMSLQDALNILGNMKLDGHIDPDLFDVFMDAKIYEQYAKEYLGTDALQPVDLDNIPGYSALN